MDASSAVLSGGVSSIIVAIVFGLYKIFKHSSCKSHCFGQEIDFQSDIGQSTRLLSKGNEGPKEEPVDAHPRDRQARSGSIYTPTVQTPSGP